ncbi:MAG: fimbrillin family protein [Bacteroidaceae bacterium]|nr:fimbrillin family protein [Bacteroidaceae bacterium]
MKAKLFLAALSAAFLAGCSSDSVVSDLTSDELNDPIARGFEPIQLSLNNSTAEVTQTRGTGTVGSTDSTTSAWYKEDLRILMLQRPGEGHWASEGFTFGLDNTRNFDNKSIARPDSVGKTVSLNYKTFTDAIRYYPATGYSQFFAYYIDDAATSGGTLIGKDNLVQNCSDTLVGTKKTPELFMTSTISGTDTLFEYKTNFQIDGSQDLMAGKATNYYPGAPIGFGAYTARRNRIPNIEMIHLLSRLEFGVIPGMRFRKNLDESVDTITDIKNVTIKGIRVQTNTTGTMTVAYLNTDEANDNTALTATEIIPASTWANPNYVSLKATPNDWRTGSEKKDMKDTTVLINFGNEPEDSLIVHAKKKIPYAVPDSTAALFVQPGLTSYSLLVDVEYALLGTGDTPAPKSDVIPLTIKMNGGGAFEAGKSYRVDLVIYGPNEIEVQVTLVPWKNAGTITIDTEDPENPAWQAAE